MIAARTYVASVSFPLNTESMFPTSALRPERFPFLLRELRFFFQIDTELTHTQTFSSRLGAPNPADMSVDIRYANKPVTHGWIPLASFAQARRPYSEFITYQPNFSMSAATLSANNLPIARPISHVTHRLQNPLPILTSFAELSVRIRYDNLLNVWGDVSPAIFNGTLVLVGENLPALYTLPRTIDVPYVSAFRKIFPIEEQEGGPAFPLPYPFKSSRMDLTNGTPHPLRMRGLTGLLSGRDAIYYGTTFASLRQSGASINDVMVQMYDWKGRAITRSVAPFVDVIDRVNRRWPARAEIPPNGYFYIAGEVVAAAQNPDTGNHSLLLVAMHGTRTEKI